MFMESNYIASNGKQNIMFIMNRDAVSKHCKSERRLDKFWDSTHLSELMLEIIVNEPDISSPNLGDRLVYSELTIWYYIFTVAILDNNKRERYCSLLYLWLTI